MSNPTPPNITKACSNCGKQKPLSAFLEMSETQGTTYGNVCSSCRKILLEAAERRKKTEAEGSTTSETGHKIDSKAKVHDAIDKRETKQRIEEEYHAERKVEEEISQDQNNLKQQADAVQKKHRDDFLKKPPFLSGKRTEVSRDPLFRQRADAANKAQRENEKVVSTAQEIKEERKKTEHDFTVTNQGEQITGQIRFSGHAFQQFRQRLQGSAPIAKNLNQAAKDAATARKETGVYSETLREKKKEEDPVKFIEENWRPGGPSSKR